MSKSGRCKVVGYIGKSSIQELNADGQYSRGKREKNYLSENLEMSPERLEHLRLARIAVIAEKIERIESWEKLGKSINLKNLENLKAKLSTLQ